MLIARGSSGSSPALTWGSTPGERGLRYPCDRYVIDPHGSYFRAVDVDAPAVLVFRWLCQLRATPYSYDWIDNLGRGSPQTLTPCFEDLALGQTFMTMFELVEFDRDRHLTLRANRFHWTFGEVSVTYMVVPVARGRCRLVVKLLGRYPLGTARRLLLPPIMAWLDLFMMRRQLLNLKALAERDAAR